MREKYLLARPHRFDEEGCMVVDMMKPPENREQVRDGAAILSFLLPIFIDLMMDNPDDEWGKPFYPLVET